MGSEGVQKAWGPLHVAIYRGSAAEVRELLTKPGVDKEERLERSFTPLSLAAQYGRTDCIAEVCAWFSCSSHPSTSLSIPLVFRQPRLQRRVDFRCHAAASAAAAAAAHISVPLPTYPTACQLVEGGVNIEARSDRAFTPLLLAAKGGHLDAVRELRLAGAAVEAKNDRSFTPLLIACQNNHEEVRCKYYTGDSLQ